LEILLHGLLFTSLIFKINSNSCLLCKANQNSQKDKDLVSPKSRIKFTL
jgi:hypothetical protein